MRIFIAGGTGAIGRPLVARLLSDGHEVTVFTRSAERAGAVKATGGHGVVGDALDSVRLKRAIHEAQPEVVVNQLTNLSQTPNPMALLRGLKNTERLRTEASVSLVEGAIEAGAKRIIAQSISFAYKPGEGTRTEDDPLFRDGGKQIQRLVKALTDLETATLGATIEGVVLRYGTFYGPGTYYFPGGMFTNLVAKRRLPIPGTGTGKTGFLHIDDAVNATVLAMTGPIGTYNVVDAAPVSASEWVPHLARLLGAKPPRHIPFGLAKAVLGEFSTYLFCEQPAVSNHRAIELLGWKPVWPSWKEGFSSIFN